MLLERDQRPGGEPSGGWGGQYVLDDDNVPVPETDILVWGRWMQDDERRRVDRTCFPRTGSTWMQPWSPYASTVFLGLDHNFHDRGPPILFETMIFGHRKHDDHQTRCATWGEAEAMHALAMELVMRDRWLPDLIRNFGSWCWDLVFNRWHGARVRHAWMRPPWRYWRDRLLNRYVIVTIGGAAHKAFVRSPTTLRLVGTPTGSVTITTESTAGIAETAPRGVDKWLSKFSSAASRIRSALRRSSNTPSG